MAAGEERLNAAVGIQAKNAQLMQEDDREGESEDDEEVMSPSPRRRKGTVSRKGKWVDIVDCAVADFTKIQGRLRAATK